jgi:elongation of very long chain fatty acids protein 6
LGSRQPYLAEGRIWASPVKEELISRVSVIIMVELLWESTFDTRAAIEWARAHADVPIFAVSAYLIIVFYVPAYIGKPWRLRGVWCAWNLFLSCFSVVGAARTVPHLYNTLQAEGFVYTVCTEPETWYLRGVTGFWVSLFIFSKIPELLDTVFLVLQKKEVIFLHWFHHVTVLLYCWHAYTSNTATGLWFCALNYSVHAVMYLYYFLSITGGSFRRIARPIAPCITLVQLIQMVVGSFVTVAAGLMHSADPNSCSLDPSNFRLGLAMYLSYFFLFSVLFYNLYLKPSGKHAFSKSVTAGKQLAPGDSQESKSHTPNMTDFSNP